MTDYTDDPRYKAFLQDAKEQLPELIGDSSVCIALVTENGPDPKFCIELGYMVMLDKPIIILVRPGGKVSSKLIAVADEIVEWNGDLADSGLNEALDQVAAKLKK